MGNCCSSSTTTTTFDTRKQKHDQKRNTLPNGNSLRGSKIAGQMSHFEEKPSEAKKVETPKQKREEKVISDTKTVEVKDSAPATVESQFAESPREKQIQSTNDKASARESIPKIQNGELKPIYPNENLLNALNDAQLENDEGMEFIRNESQPVVQIEDINPPNNHQSQRTQSRSQIELAKNDIQVAQTDILFTNSISIPDSSHKDTFNLPTHSMHREKTIAQQVEEKLFERSIKSYNLRQTNASRRDNTQFSKRRDDTIKQLKASLIHSIVQNQDKLSARSASVESQKMKPMLFEAINEIEENRQSEVAVVRNSLLQNSLVQNKPMHDVRSEGSLESESIESDQFEREDDVIQPRPTNDTDVKGEGDDIVLDLQNMDDPISERLEAAPEEEQKDVKEQLNNINAFLQGINKKDEGLKKMKTVQDQRRKSARPLQPAFGSSMPRISTDSPRIGGAEGGQDPFKEYIKYKSVDDDIVDKMLEKFILSHQVQVPINRIDPSKYLFGTKIIAAQIINGILMVRVGGGFMSIEEFVDKHQSKEILNLRLKMVKERKKLPKITQELIEKHKIKKFI
ncbi:hypothetical protein FGO68_gene15457 [Halteria grandinella]|uniref:GAR domain-containing protein n=1 Tax=Halteria grandinella TaxID=5974 RepID=A0A8J8NUR0_HALGN|nr:hypothetical protein FGO68_gene15457 [Halteria grandinella]